MIRVDYDSARRQASILQEVANEYEETSRSLKRTLSEVADCWEGAAANAFILATQRRITQLNKLCDEAKSIAKQIRRAADEFEAAEQRLKAEMESQAQTDAAVGSFGAGASS